MPWNNQPGGQGTNGQGPRGPWSRGPAGGRPPDLDDLVQRLGARIRQRLPQGGFTRGMAAGVIAAIFGLWILSGIYFVNGHEQGIVLRFGAVVGRSSQGINYHLPWPIETAQVVDVNKTNQLNIGYQAVTEFGDNAQISDLPQESLMLTGDENIVDIHFTVGWVVSDLSAYVFNVDNPDKVVKAVAESAMREVVGQHLFDSIITQDRTQVQIRVREIMQKTLDLYGAGITITSIHVGEASPPVQVNDASREVQSAREDQEATRDAAEGYATKAVHEARGKAAQIVQQAEAYRQQAIAEASGEARQFLSVYEEYRKAPEVTRRRIYLETMSQVLGQINKVIVDGPTGRNVMPYLPLPDLPKDRGEGPHGAPASGAQAGQP